MSWGICVMSRLRRVVVLAVTVALTLGLGACHRFVPDGHFKSAIHKRAKIGDPLQDVEDRLSAIRFSCHPFRADDAEGKWVTCTRLQEGLLASCIDRANLHVSDDDRIAAIEIKKPACASF